MRPLLILCGAIVLCDTMFFAALTPLLPEYADEFELSKTGAGALQAAGVHRVRAVHLPVDLEEARATGHVVGLLGRLHRLVAAGGVLVEGAVVELVEAT